MAEFQAFHHAISSQRDNLRRIEKNSQTPETDVFPGFSLLRNAVGWYENQEILDGNKQVISR